MSDNGEVDLSDFADMWAEASEAESAGSDDTGATDTPPEVLTGLEGESDTDNVEDESATEAVAPVTDKPDGASDDWDWSAHADRPVPVKVRGEESVVALKELRDGYMRQQDYTRATQEIAQARKLAQWAQDVQNGFEADPEGMIEAFERAFKVTRGERVDPLAEVDEDLRPVYQQNLQLQQEMAELREAMGRSEQARVVEGVRRELEVLKGEFGEAFDPKETILVAQRYNLPLKEAHYLRTAQTGYAPHTPSPPEPQPVVGAEATEAAARQAEEARLAGKAAAQGTVPKSRFKASDIATDQFSDIGELFELVRDSSQT